MGIPFCGKGLKSKQKVVTYPVTVPPLLHSGHISLGRSLLQDEASAAQWHCWWQFFPSKLHSTHRSTPWTTASSREASSSVSAWVLCYETKVYGILSNKFLLYHSGGQPIAVALTCFGPSRASPVIWMGTAETSSPVDWTTACFLASMVSDSHCWTTASCKPV